MKEKKRGMIKGMSSSVGLKREVILSWDVMVIQGGGEKAVWVKDWHAQRPCRGKELVSSLQLHKQKNPSNIPLYLGKE